jgi:Domain of unknown function (DUF4136)
MTLKPFPTLVFVACLLPGCATVGPIETSGDPASLPAFRTFHVYEEQFVFATEISAEQRAHVSRELRQAAVSALNERGYREAADADVFVTLGAISRPVLDTGSESSSSRLHPVDTSVLDTGRPPGVPESERMPSGAGREGDLILYLLDPKTHRALWRASSSGSATTPAEALRKARATYKAMVEQLPRAADGPK